MEVLSFIEWCNKKRHTVISEIKFVDVLDFYNQKFDVGMLVNNVQKRYTTRFPYSICGDWFREEDKRLFEWWEKKGENDWCFKEIGVCKNNIAVANNEPNFIIIHYKSGRVWYFDTLNEFITLAKKESKLQWNTNNQTIKNLFN